MKTKIILGFVFLILLSSFGFGEIITETGGTNYYNFSDTTDLWGSTDAVNVGASSDSSYPLFNMSGDSSPSSYSFDGNNDYIQTVNLGTNWSLSFWAYITTYDALDVLVGSRSVTGSQREFFFDHDGSGTATYYWYNGGTGFAGSVSGSITENAWNHIVLTRDGNDVEWFADGISQGTDSTSSKGDFTINVVLGRNGDQSIQYFDGKIDEVKIYNYKMDIDDVTLLYNYGTTNYSTPPPPPTSNFSTITNLEYYGVSFQNDTETNINRTLVSNGTHFNTPNDGYVDKFGYIRLNGADYELSDECLDYPELSVKKYGFDNYVGCYDTNGTFIERIAFLSNPTIGIVTFSGDYYTEVADSETYTTSLYANVSTLQNITIFATDYLDVQYFSYNVTTNLTVNLTPEKSINTTFFNYINISGDLYYNDSLTIQYDFYNCPANHSIEFYTNGSLRNTTTLECSVNNSKQNISYLSGEGYYTSSFTATYNTDIDTETYSFDGISFTADYTAPSIEYLQALNTTVLSNDLTEYFNVTDSTTYVDNCTIGWVNIDTGYNTSTLCNSSIVFSQAGIYNITITAKDVINNTNITTNQFTVDPVNNVTFLDAKTGSPLGNVSINVDFPSYTTTAFTTDGNGTIYLNSVYGGSVQAGNYTFSFPANQGFITPLNFTESINATDMPYNLEYNISRANLTIRIYDRETQEVLNTTDVYVTIQGLGAFNTSTGLIEIENLTIASSLYTLFATATGYSLTQLAFTYTNQENLTVDLYMLNSSSPFAGNLITLVYDEFYNTQIGVDTRLLEYDATTDSFFEVAQCLTDSNGQCVFSVELNRKVYKVTTSKVIDGILYTAVSTEAGSIIALDETLYEMHLFTESSYSVENLFNLQINITNTSLIGNTSYLTANFYDGSGLSNTVCIGYYYKNRSSLVELTTNCVTASSGEVNVAGGYLLNRSFNYVVDVYAIDGDGNRRVYGSYPYNATDGFEDSLDLFLKPILLFLSLIGLAVAMWSGRIEIFAIISIPVSIITLSIAPSFTSAGLVAVSIVWNINILYLARKRNDNDAV